MQFNSLHFVFFLPAVFVLHWLLPFRYRWLLLLAASYYFYAICNPLFSLLLLGTTIIDWYAALKIEQAVSPKNKKNWLLLSILSNLLVLAGFKYSVFLYNSFAGASNAVFDSSYSLLENILIPAGLSFYTFQSMSYTIDVYRGKTAAEPNAARFALFVSFFPQLVAGPVERYGQLAPQFKTERLLRPELLLAGTRLMLWGFFKKIVIADRLAEFVNPVFAAPENFHGFTLLAAGFFFVVQVYCDFSGYSDIATGCARWFGYELQLNWRRPLFSRSLHEFWSRNHISLTSWFRDYLYIPLGGSRCSKSRWRMNIFLTFLISGLWHGAGWTFAAWGAMHGIVYIIETFLAEKWKRPAWANGFGWIYLIGFHTLSLIAFRAGSMHDLGIFYSRIFSGQFDIASSLIELRTLNDLFPLLLSLVLIVFLFIKEMHEEKGILNKLPAFENWLRPAFYILVFAGLFLAGQFNSNTFIYFHF
ncbi:MAG: algI [Bacteroidetes bacterium]|nr:MAG: algI [Bacteroidota bacterium]